MPEIRGSQIQDSSIESIDIKDGTITNNDIATNANIDQSKISQSGGWISQSSATIEITEGETIATYLPCYIKNDGKSYIATKNDINKCVVTGFKTASGVLQTSGVIINSGWALTPGLICYLGNGGAIIQDVDLISSIYGEAIVVLGKAITATSIDVNIGAPIINGEEEWGTNVVAKYYITTSAQTISSGSWLAINFDNKEQDTHDAVTTGSDWKFIAPYDGYYHIDCMISFASLTGTENLALSLYKNNGLYSRFHRQVISYSSISPSGNGSATIYLLAGDKLQIFAYSSIATTLYSDSTGTYSWVSIQLVVGQIATWTGDSIVESRSNSNGSWIKYSDGTMECYGKKTISVSSATITYSPLGQIIYPATFISQPVPVVSLDPAAHWNFTFMGVQNGTVDFNVVINNTGAAQNILLSWQAIGRWKA